MSFLCLAVAASVASAGEQTAAQPRVGSQTTNPALQNKGSQRSVRSALDPDSFRVRLLTTEIVQRDLALSADQVEKLRDVAKTSDAQSRQSLAKVRELFPPSQSYKQQEFEARMQRFRELSEDSKAKAKELRTKSLAVLTPSQRERLKQIELQARIPAALTRPEIVKALHISEQQFAKIIAMRAAMDRKEIAFWPDPRGVGAKERQQKLSEYLKRSNELRAETTNRILDVLTPAQRAKLHELQGKTIDVTRLYSAIFLDGPEF